jgi:MFS family permease
VQGLPMALAMAVSLTLTEPPVAKEESAGQSYLAILTSGARYFLGHRILRILALDMVVVSALPWLIIWLYQPLLRLAGVELEWFGGVHAVMSLAQIVVLSQVDNLERLLGTRRRLLWLGAFVAGFSFVMLGLVQAVAAVIFFIWLASAFGLSRRPLFSSYMNRYIPSGMRATVLSAASMFTTLGIAVVNLVAGWAADISVRGTMLVVGAALLGFSFLSRIREEHLLEGE